MPDEFLQLLLQSIPSRQILKNEPLKEHTTIKVGGPADYFISVETPEQVSYVLDSASRAGVQLFVLGNGSNILALDGGVRGAILNIGKSMAGITVKANGIVAEAGASLSALARCAADNGLAGLEYLCGIPGTVGGGVTMNAGAYGQEICAHLRCVRIYNGSLVKTISRDEMRFGYRSSAVQKNHWIVLSAEFELLPDSTEQILARMNTLNAVRRDKQPLQYPSAGSFFKRPVNHFAGALIEQAGLKGFCIGGAKISELHAGFLINTGGAKARDFSSLMAHVQSTVFAKTGVWLLPEVHIIGQEKE